MQTIFTSTGLAPIASRLLLILAVVLGHCCLSTLPAHALGLMDGMQEHVSHAPVDAPAMAMADHVFSQAPDACGNDAPLMAERSQFHTAVPVALPLPLLPGVARLPIPHPSPEGALRPSRDWLQIYLI
ncbi:MAG: hypothetical protein OEY97_01585 [Nitrospirota bacterium]|nr:hypothetical protein [Nitrospirota bacterium]